MLLDLVVEALETIPGHVERAMAPDHTESHVPVLKEAQAHLFATDWTEAAVRVSRTRHSAEAAAPPQPDA